MTAKPLIVGIGELLWDVLPNARLMGGAPANFAFQAGQLGAEGIVVSSIGEDAHGDALQAELTAKGLSADFLRRNDRPTGTVTVTTDAHGQPTYNIHTDVAWDFLPFDAPLQGLAVRADAVCFGTLAQRSLVSRRSIQAFLQATRRDCLRVFDINLRQNFYDAATIEASLNATDVLKLNHEELPILARLLHLSEKEDAAIEALLHNYSLRLAALTRGGDGSVLYTKHRVSPHTGYPAAVVDTVGAGDAFTAALVWGMLHSEDLDRIHDRAGKLASYVCSQQGGTPRLPEGF